MLPFIIEALTGLFEGGAAVEGMAAASTAVKGANAIEGASVLGEAKMADNVPGVLRSMQPAKFGTPQVKGRTSSRDTMDRIMANHTGDSDKPKGAANDSENMFAGGAHLTTDGRNNHIMDMFKGGKDKFYANDNTAEVDSTALIVAEIAKLEPLVDAISRNTYQINAQLEELNNAFDQWFNNQGESKFEALEDKIETVSQVSTEQAVSSTTDQNRETFLKEAAESKKKNTIVQGLMTAAAGGLLKGAGSLISDPSKNAFDVSPGGGLGAPGDGRPRRRPGGGRVKVDDSPVTGDFTGRQRALLHTISSHEGANYDTVFGNGKYGSPNKKLTDMTIEEVNQFQSQLQARTKAAGIGKINGRVVGTSAVGKGQFVQGTLKNTLQTMGYDKSDFKTLKYTPELQNRLILQLAKNNGMDPNRPETLRNQHKVGGQWESLAAHKISNRDFNRAIDQIAAASTQIQRVAENTKPQLASNMRGERVGQGSKVNANSAKMAANITQQFNVYQNAAGQTSRIPVRPTQVASTKPTPPSARQQGHADSWLKYFGLG
jgi:hypothetical protein